MALLSTADKDKINAAVQRIWSRRREILGALTKQELRTQFNNIDQWVEDNQTTFNQAFDVGPRAALTQPQKAFILFAVVSKRVGENLQLED